MVYIWGSTGRAIDKTWIKIFNIYIKPRMKFPSSYKISGIESFFIRIRQFRPRLDSTRFFIRNLGITLVNWQNLNHFQKFVEISTKFLNCGASALHCGHPIASETALHNITLKIRQKKIFSRPIACHSAYSRSTPI